MRVFKTFQGKAGSSHHSNASSSGAKKNDRPPRMRLSPSEIRARVKNATKKAEPQPKEKISGTQASKFMEEDSAKIKTKSTPDSVNKKSALKKENSGAEKTSALKADSKTENAQKETKEAAEGKKEEKVVVGDVGLNDPKDPNTQEKLKNVISSGAFAFGPKERETLEQILER